MRFNGLEPGTTVIPFQANNTVRENGRVLVASGTRSRNRDWWTGKPYRLVPNGMRLDAWQKNPLVLYMHDFSIPLGKGEMFLEDGKLWAYEDIEFHRMSVPVSGIFRGFGMFETAVIADLWKEGYLNAVSIHIMLTPEDEQAVMETDDEIVIPTSEVLEFSIVTLPGDRESVREQELMQKFTERGVAADIAECVACTTESHIMTPALPVWARKEKYQTAKRGRDYQFNLPEVTMSKNTKVEKAEVAEETPVESSAEEVEATLEATLEVTEELVAEHEIELPIADVVQAVVNDPEALSILAQALVGTREFQDAVYQPDALPLQEIAAQVPPQTINIRFVSSNKGQEQAQPVARQQVAQNLGARNLVQQSAQPVRQKAVPLPEQHLNGNSRKPSKLSLVRESVS